MLPLAHMMNLFTNKFPRLRARRLPLSRIFPRSLHRFFFRHVVPPPNNVRFVLHEIHRPQQKRASPRASTGRRQDWNAAIPVISEEIKLDDQPPDQGDAMTQRGTNRGMLTSGLPLAPTPQASPSISAPPAPAKSLPAPPCNPSTSRLPAHR